MLQRQLCCGERPWMLPPSLPLNRPGRFRRHVIDNTIDSLDLIDNARSDTSEKSMVEVERIRSHAVCRGDCAQGADTVVSARVSHHTYGSDRKKHRKRLPDAVVKTGPPDLIEINRIGLTQNL